jgi:hypothetical protein
MRTSVRARVQPSSETAAFSTGDGAPGAEVLDHRAEEPHRPAAVGLGRLERPIRSPVLDDQASIADAIPPQRERLAGAQAGVGEQGEQGRLGFLKPSAGLEPATPSLPWKCSTN